MALIRTRTCPGPADGSGTSSSLSTSGPPNSRGRMAFMIGIVHSADGLADQARFAAERPGDPDRDDYAGRPHLRVWRADLFDEHSTWPGDRSHADPVRSLPGAGRAPREGRNVRGAAGADLYAARSADV